MAGPTRARRLFKRVQEIVASAIERKIKDRRLEFVTITDCRATGDLYSVTILYTVRGRMLDEEPDYEPAAAALEKAKGQLRSLVGRGTGICHTSMLALEVDTVPEIPTHLKELLDKARTRDAELVEQARNTKPADDINPYRDEE